LYVLSTHCKEEKLKFSDVKKTTWHLNTCENIGAKIIIDKKGNQQNNNFSLCDVM
jgi:hypothetical protein